MSEIFIQVRFKRQTDVGEYHDALYFSQEEYVAKTADEIEALKQQRVDNWVNAVKNPPEAAEPTVEQLQYDLEAIEDQKVQLREKLSRAVDKQLEKMTRGNSVR
jgi:hypothetical protein